MSPLHRTIPLVTTLVFFTCSLLPSSNAETVAIGSPPQNSPPVFIRGDLGRSGFFDIEGLKTSGAQTQSPKLFKMVRDRVIMDGGRHDYIDGRLWVMMGNSYKTNFGFDFSIPIVWNNTVFFSLYIGDGYLYALDAATGQLKWVTRRAKGQFSEPAVAADMLFVGADAGLFYALNLKTQREQWRDQTKDNSFVTASPVVHQGMVYFGRNNGVFYALNAQTGAHVWTHDTKAQSYLVEPVLDDSRVYLSSWRRVFALDATTGKEEWSYLVPGERILSIVLSGSTVYVVNASGTIYSLDAQTGKLTAHSGRYGRTFLTPSIADTTLYFSEAKDGKLIAVDGSTAKLKWRSDAKNCNAPALTKRHVYATCGDGKLYALDLATGKKEWELGKFQSTLSPPFITNDAIYFVSDDGRLHVAR